MVGYLYFIPTFIHKYRINKGFSVSVEDIELNCMESSKEKRNNTISQMRLRSVFKMQISILNTATTEQMGYASISFFVYTKSTNSI